MGEEEAEVDAGWSIYESHRAPQVPVGVGFDSLSPRI
jgi:hypothetical protein